MSLISENVDGAVQHAMQRGELYTEVDGFLVYAPNASGYLTAHNLRMIADYIDSVNQPWADRIDAELKESNERHASELSD